jgi:hypothetical protein
MNGRPLTDAQISTALRDHLPEVASPGLRERVFDAAKTTAQLRSFPSFLGALSDADPVGRRRSLLIAAALLVALAAASATAVAAWRLIQQDPIDKLSLEPPADLPAFVLSSYERLPQLPPVALTWRDSDSAKGRIYVGQSGAVRFDQFASAEATEPSSYRILSPNHRISGVATVGSDKVWIEQGHEAISEDPRVFLRTIVSGRDPGPGCEMERDPSEAGNGTAAAGWRYVGLEYVAGRPTHRVTCGGRDLWIDIETRLILRTQGPAIDDGGQPTAVESTEVTEISFGDQPAALFQPPDGLRRVSAEEYKAYVCAGGLANELAPGISDCPSTEGAEATPLAEPSPRPTATPTVRPNTSDCAALPGDPSEPIGPLAWSPASLREDWPAAARPEPAGGSVQPVRLTHLDASGDTGSDGYPCVDIRGVMADTSRVTLKLASTELSRVDPTERWIAYGIVTDDDRDGVADWRYGIDNMPPEAAEGEPPNRGWRTNLHTGQTDAGPEHGDPIWPNGGDFKADYPIGSDASQAIFQFCGFAGDVAGGTNTGSAGCRNELDVPFYAWASVIVNGRVVATDYAPDTGWLVASRGARPGGTFLLGDPYPHLSMTVPDGWTTNSPLRWLARSTHVLKRVNCGDLPRDYPSDASYDADCALVSFEVINDVERRCAGEIEPPLASSFDDLVAAVASLPAITESEADVTIDGYRGKQFEYSPGEEDPVHCLLHGYEDVWLLDVDGVPLLIGSAARGDLALDVPKEAVKAEIREMVESIHFER